MNFDEIIKIEKERLAHIGSTKDPVMFHAKRCMINNSDATKNRTIIVNFTDDEHAFGCRFSCKFCSWRDRATMMGDIAPTVEGIKEFLKDFEGYKVTISGGGDPLFLVDKGVNLYRLKTIVDTIHELGFLVEVVTKETDMVVRALRSQMISGSIPYIGLIHSIDMWSFSFEAAGINGLLATELVSKINGLVRVSKVCSPGIASDNNKDALNYYVDKYIEAGAYQVLLREDFYAHMYQRDMTEDIKNIRKIEKRTNGQARYLLNGIL
jgi:hypothetical protein